MFLKPAKRIFLLVTLAVLLSSSTGCASSPKEPAREFVRSVFAGKPKDALDTVCIGEGFVVVVTLETDWGDDKYEVLSNDGQIAEVLVKGKVQWTFTTEDIQKLLSDLALIYPDVPLFTEPFSELPAGGIGVQLNIRFDSLTVIKDGDEWCIPEESVKEFYIYLVDLVIGEIE